MLPHILARGTCSHTGIVHLVANLGSLYNLVFRRSNSLLFAAAKCPSILVQSVFLQSTSICCCFCGYNTLYGTCHLKQYDIQCFASSESEIYIKKFILRMEAFSNYCMVFCYEEYGMCIYICWLLRNIMLDFSSYPVVMEREP